MLSETAFRQIVARANLAPSVHNSQPTRWRLSAPNQIELAADMSRHLRVGDPERRDLGLSCGAAIEASLLALSEIGIGADVDVSDLNATAPQGLLPIARLHLRALEGAPDPLAALVDQRQTWRGGFAPLPREDLDQIAALDPMAVHLVEDRDKIAELAGLGDQASARLMAVRAYRAELLSWMRLQPNRPDYHHDGMNRESLAMSPLMARLADIVLSGGIYPLLYALGAGPALSGEKARTQTAAAILLFHQSDSTCPIASGRRFYRIWLALAAHGAVAWPLAAIVDEPQAAKRTAEIIHLPKGRRLVAALRIGASTGRPAPSARLPLDQLLF